MSAIAGKAGDARGRDDPPWGADELRLYGIGLRAEGVGNLKKTKDCHTKKGLFFWPVSVTIAVL